MKTKNIYLLFNLFSSKQGLWILSCLKTDVTFPDSYWPPEGPHHYVKC